MASSPETTAFNSQKWCEVANKKQWIIWIQLCSLNMSDCAQLWHQNTTSSGILNVLLLIFGFYIIPYFFFHFCCLIVLVQSQSLSRRTTPFAPRVQVMGSVSLVFAHSLFTGLFFFFCFHSLENAFLGKWQHWVSLSVQFIAFFFSKKRI